jgi:phage terminase large subunit
MPITPTTCFNKIALLKKNLRIIQGGTSAGKTYSILLYLIYYAIKRELTISIVAESVPVLKRGAYKDFISILKSLDLYDEKYHNLTDRKYQLGKSTFEFFGADNPDGLRGGRRDVLFINECNNVIFDAFSELNVRTKLFTFLDFNPTAPFWVTTELIGQDNADHIVVTYKDNEFLEQKIIDEIESWEAKGETSEYYKNRWRVMGLGLLGKQEGAIFSDWKEVENLPENAQLLGSGLDFGFSQDPTSLISVYRYNGEIIVDEKIYQKGLLNSQIANLIKTTDSKDAVIYADSAEPKSIAELRAYGLTVLPVVKGKDSINYGISLMQEHQFKVTSRSTNLIKELQNYTWAKDREGNSLNVPIDNWNHAIDALRYFFLMKMGNKKTTFALKWKR